MACEMQAGRSPALVARLFRERTNSRRRLRHPKVPAGWNIAARRSLTRRCYRAGRDAVSGDQAELPGPRDGLGPVGGAELAQDVGHVLLDRIERHNQVVGDALV
jgi:hypothetical protein